MNEDMEWGRLTGGSVFRLSCHPGEAAIVLVALIGLTFTPSVRSEVESMVDLSRAVVVTPRSLAGPERKAIDLLVEDVTRRSGIRWKVANRWPDAPGPVVAVGPASAIAGFAGPFAGPLRDQPRKTEHEGYFIRTEINGPAVLVVGNDARGVLFGVGRLLRELRTTDGKVLLPAAFQIETAPKYSLRGHQLGYRPKTNSYDGWDLPQWERYIRDLAIFGTNAVELIPPRSDDDSDSPHFPRPPLQMMVGMSKLLDAYGLDCWIWYPAMDKDYADPATVAFALREWDDVFRGLPRLDAVFVPGGDPGHTAPAVLLPFLGKVAEVLHRSHPRATLWVSPQGFNQDWLDQFLKIVNTRELPWLSGIVHGPQVRVSMADLRKAVPARYPIRTYPDITHSQQCQFPVPDWDLAFSLTEGREVINPRPRGHADIFHYYQPGSIGFITYSEGCNDDVNKCIWSGLGWGPGADVEELLRQYARAFIGEEVADEFARGLFALERNWQGPLLPHAAVEKTFRQFHELWGTANPQILSNWRFQQALYRASYDSYVRKRLIAETDVEKHAYEALGKASQKGSLEAIKAVEAIFDRSRLQFDQQALRGRIHNLAEDLFVSIRMQLSVPFFDAIAVDRGANLDTLDVPLNDRLWLHDQLAKVKKLKNEADRLRAIEAIVHRTDPGPGGFYDDLGNLTKQPHLVHDSQSASDPDFRHSSLVGFGSRAGWPLAWCRNAQTLHDAPLRMHYDGLEARGRYKVRVVYAGDSFRNQIRLDADEVEVHGWYKKPNPPVPVEFDIPAGATQDGNLILTWRQEPGKGGNGRGCQVAEVWLIKK
ncbi:MAG: hypothetical protein ACP5XB_16845 [Isosphaeraceae bacterium]